MIKFNNILVVRTDRIGDVVLTVPALRALRQTYPDTRISVWTSPLTRELLEGLPFVNEVITENHLRGWFGYLDLVQSLHARRFDLAIILHSKRRTNMACFLAGIPRRLGFFNNKFGFLLTDRVPDTRHEGKIHEAEYCLALVKHLCVSSNDLRLELPFHRETEAWAADLLYRHKFSGNPIVIMHPDASCPTRRWPAESYAELARSLVHHCRAKVIIVGGGASARQAAAVIKTTVPQNDVLDLTNQTSLLQLGSLARRCRVFLSADSGPVHIAAAVGATVAVIFMRDQPGINFERWRPLGRNVIVFRNKPGDEILLNNKGEIYSGRLDSIQPEDVFLKLAPLLVYIPKS